MSVAVTNTMNTFGWSLIGPLRNGNSGAIGEVYFDIFSSNSSRRRLLEVGKEWMFFGIDAILRAVKMILRC